MKRKNKSFHIDISLTRDERDAFLDKLFPIMSLVNNTMIENTKHFFEAYIAARMHYFLFQRLCSNFSTENDTLTIHCSEGFCLYLLLRKLPIVENEVYLLELRKRIIADLEQELGIFPPKTAPRE